MIVYRVKRSSAREPAASRGALVYEAAHWDFGLAAEDTALTGVEHVSVTLDEAGQGASFTMPLRDLRRVRQAELSTEPWSATLLAGMVGRVRGPAPVLSVLFGRAGLLVALASILLTGVVFGWHPRLDFHSSDFFEDMQPSWEWHHAAWVRYAHELGHWLETIVLASLAGELVRRVIWPGARLFARGRAILAALLIGCLGPHVVDLAPEAAHIARPRPYGNIEAFEHGDRTAFRPWWASATSCQQHCSTTSREVAEAAVTISAAAILPGGVGVLATGLAVAFTAWTALLRVGTGEAYLSDALFAVLLLHVLAWMTFRALRAGAGSDDDSDIIESWLTRLGFALGRWAGLARASLRRQRSSLRAAGPTAG